MDFKQKYLLAKKNGKKDRFRADEISRRIAKVYPLSDQIGLLADKDDKPDEWAAYQEFRANVKRIVDSEISAIEEQLII